MLAHLTELTDHWNWLWTSPIFALAIGAAYLTGRIGNPRSTVDGELTAIVTDARDSLASGVTAELTAQQVTAQLTALTARVWTGDRLPVTEVTASR